MDEEYDAVSTGVDPLGSQKGPSGKMIEKVRRSGSAIEKAIEIRVALRSVDGLDDPGSMVFILCVQLGGRLSAIVLRHTTSSRPLARYPSTQFR